MISTKYVSFLLGIIIASLTWAFSLYLYSRILQNLDIESSTVNEAHELTKSLYENSEKLIQELQSVPVKSSMNLNQGKCFLIDR